MPRSPRIPLALPKGTFSLDEARAAGLTLSALRGKAWVRIGAELYRRAAQSDDTFLTLAAWRRLLPDDVVFAGDTAAWLFGLDVEATSPVEIVAPPRSGIRSRRGLIVGRYAIPPNEVVSIRGFRVTALPRTLAGLCLRRTAVEALVAIDMAIHLKLIDSAALGRYSEAAKGRPGTGRLRSLASLAAPAESPMETRLRWLLIQAGLPRPEVQTELKDAAARSIIARADLFYPPQRLVIEYDGTNHRERLVDDNRRQNLLINAGFRLLRFTAADIRWQPEVVVAQVRSALSSGRSKNERLTSDERNKTLGTARLTPHARSY